MFLHSENVEETEIAEDETVKELLSRRYDDTVLVAEDDDDIRNYLFEELSDNFNVLVASNGYEATQMVLENNVSIVLSDVLMPHINGFQLCRDFLPIDSECWLM